MPKQTKPMQWSFAGVCQTVGSDEREKVSRNGENYFAEAFVRRGFSSPHSTFESSFVGNFNYWLEKEKGARLSSTEEPGRQLKSFFRRTKSN